MSPYSVKNKLSLPALLLLFGQGWALPALSEDDINGKETSAAKPLEEVIVTARKREESLLDVPISITAFGADILSNPTIDDISNLAALAPNVEFSSSPPISGTSNAAAVFIRGIGQNDFLATNDPGVGIYLDGVYIARSVGGVLKVNDIERVEILRGPQGTLFGKNTIGGAVNVVSRLPSNEARASVALTGGSKDRQDVALSAEGPLAENLTGRISLLDENRAGYVERTLDGKDLGNINRLTTKANLAWQAADWANFRLGLDSTHQRQNGAAEVMTEISVSSRDLSTIPPSQWTLYETFNTLIAAPVYDSQWDARWLSEGRLENYGTGPSEDNIDVDGASLIGDFNLSPSVLLTSITGYRTLNGTYSRDADSSPLPHAHLITEDEQSQFSQELQLTGKNIDSLSWTLGLFYFNEEVDNHQDAIIMDGIFAATGGFADATFDLTNQVDVDSRAIFGQATWQATEKLALTGGGRFTREQKDFFIDVFTANNKSQIIGPEQKPTDTWNNSSPMFSADYKYAPKGMVYASYSEGFKGGGYNGRQINPPTDPVSGVPFIDTFDPEEATSFEAGFKQEFNIIALQGAVFSTDYTNMQVSVLTPGINNLIAVTIDNAAKAKIDGAELEAQATLSAVKLSSGIGYLNARYSDLSDNTLLNKNAELEKIPEWNAHISGQYDLDLDDLGLMEFVLSLSYKSKTYNDPLNIESMAQPGFSLLNGNVTWSSMSKNLKLSLFGNNLTDEKYLMSGASALDSVGNTTLTLARGRELGLTLSYEFN